MKYLLLLAAHLLCGAVVHAQAPADTLGYPKSEDLYYLGDFVHAGGRQERAYLPARHIGYERVLNYYSPPGQKVMAMREVIKIEQVHSMTVRGRYYENVALDGKPGDILALRVVSGPLELFAYAEPGIVRVPGPGAAVLHVNAYTNNHWYLHRGNEFTLIRRNKFAAQLSALLADYPALAQRVAAGETSYRYANMPAIVASRPSRSLRSQELKIKNVMLSAAKHLARSSNPNR